jgi:hypothetical protein
MTEPTKLEVQFVLFLIDFLEECNPKEGEYRPPSRELVEWAKGYVKRPPKEPQP